MITLMIMTFLNCNFFPFEDIVGLSVGFIILQEESENFKLMKNIIPLF
jgi:hypothetical protein